MQTRTSYLYENNLRYQLKGPAYSNGKANWAGLYCAGILKWACRTSINIFLLTFYPQYYIKTVNYKT